MMENTPIPIYPRDKGLGMGTATEVVTQRPFLY